MKAINITALFATTLFAAAFTACSSDDETTGKPVGELLNVEKEVALTAKTEDYAVKVTADCHWDVTVRKSAAWDDFTVAPLSGDGNGTLVITTSQNHTIVERTDTIILTTKGGLREVIIVRQSSSNADLGINADQFRFAAVPAAAQNLIINCNTSWEIQGTEAIGWLHLDKTSGTGNQTVVITADEIQDDIDRAATFMLKANDNSYTISVTQEAKSSISLSVSTNELPIFQGTGGDQMFRVESNAAWRVFVPTSARQWLRIEPEQGVGNGEVRVFCEPNPNEQRERMSLIIVTAGSHNPQQCDIFVQQQVGSHENQNELPQPGDNILPQF